MLDENYLNLFTWRLTRFFSSPSSCTSWSVAAVVSSTTSDYSLSLHAHLLAFSLRRLRAVPGFPSSLPTHFNRTMFCCKSPFRLHVVLSTLGIVQLQHIPSNPTQVIRWWWPCLGQTGFFMPVSDTIYQQATNRRQWIMMPKEETYLVRPGKRSLPPRPLPTYASSLRPPLLLARSHLVDSLAHYLVKHSHLRPTSSPSSKRRRRRFTFSLISVLFSSSPHWKPDLWSSEFVPFPLVVVVVVFYCCSLVALNLAAYFYWFAATVVSKKSSKIWEYLQFNCPQR